MYNGLSEHNKRELVGLVDIILGRGHYVSVWDGDGDWALAVSDDREAIIDALGEMDMDVIEVRDGVNKVRRGRMSLVYGNEPGVLINDYNVDPEMEEISQAFEREFPCDF